jgi:hypothetical protein
MTEKWTIIAAAVGKVLVGKVAGQTEGNRYAQDRGMRIARTAERLADALPAEDRPRRVDLVKVAAMYTCVGLTAAAGKKSVEAAEEGIELATDQLPGLLGATDVELTLRMLGEFRAKGPKLPEARLLADAVALEDMGLVGLWNQTRTFHAAGKTLEQVAKLWKTQQEYGYWETRLRDGLHFDVSRRVAEARLAGMQAVFTQMLREHLGEDVA